MPKVSWVVLNGFYSQFHTLSNTAKVVGAFCYTVQYEIDSGSEWELITGGTRVGM